MTEHLKKHLCVECIKQACTQENIWNDEDDLYWAEGFVICPKHVRKVLKWYLQNGIPTWCPYALEHIVSE